MHHSNKLASKGKPIGDRTRHVIPAKADIQKVPSKTGFMPLRE
jgi:hypothetical protein